MNYFELENRVEFFINSLKNSEFSYDPVERGLPENNPNLSLGFNCYALKTLYTINSSLLRDLDFVNKQINYLKSFSTDTQNYPPYSFLDFNYLKHYKKQFPFLYLKNIIKFFLRRISFKEISPNFKLNEFIKAETKQSISTLRQLGEEYKKYNKGFPKTNKEIVEFSKSLDWSKPWNSGAQLSGVCIFNSYSENIEDIRSGIDSLLVKLVQSDGAYYSGTNIGSSEKINGAMKVISGMDWLNISIHKPEELIDTCLKHIPNSEGCDLVDVVYVLYKCNQLTDFKQQEIKNYLEKLLPIIMSHYHPDQGGFSYFKNQSQTHYYGVKVSEGLNTADIHGTTLLVWALSMIFHILGEGYPNWSIIKP